MKFLCIAMGFFLVACSSIDRRPNDSSETNRPPRSPEESKMLYDQWEKVLSPLAGTSESLGSTSAGCIRGAESLMPLRQTGLEIMRPSRRRYYGHPELLRYLQDLGQKMKAEGLTILVGDLGRPRGGPMRSGHMSHQTGLDADIWFLLPKRTIREQDRESLSAPSYVENWKLKSTWTKYHDLLLKKAAEDPRVDRIFVHPVIKKSLCEKEEAPWLRKLRAWWGHDDHLHVRISCPEASQTCTPQEPVEEGSGCQAEDFLWWFTEEAKKEEEKRKSAPPTPRPFPYLPEACESFVNQ